MLEDSRFWFVWFVHLHSGKILSFYEGEIFCSLNMDVLNATHVYTRMPSSTTADVGFLDDAPTSPNTPKSIPHALCVS